MIVCDEANFLNVKQSRDSVQMKPSVSYHFIKRPHHKVKRASSNSAHDFCRFQTDKPVCTVEDPARLLPESHLKQDPVQVQAQIVVIALYTISD